MSSYANLNPNNILTPIKVYDIHGKYRFTASFTQLTLVVEAFGFRLFLLSPVFSRIHNNLRWYTITGSVVEKKMDRKIKVPSPLANTWLLRSVWTRMSQGA